MVERKTILHGIYPRSELLVETSRAVERNRVPPEEYERSLQTDLQNLVHLQKSQGFSYIEDGKLNWPDIFRPIVGATEGLLVGELTRWFDNNTFFRKPIITGKLRLDKNKLAGYFPKVAPDNRWKVTLPSPYTLAKLSDDRTTNSFGETLENLTLITKTLIEHLEERGVAMVQLNEPYLPYHGVSPTEINHLVQSLAMLDFKNRLALLAIHFYFGDASPIIAQLDRQDKIVNAVGIDFFETRLSDLPRESRSDIIAGVLDSRNSLVEDEVALRKFIDEIATHTQASTLYITHNADLEFLPESITRKKVELLGALGRQ